MKLFALFLSVLATAFAFPSTQFQLPLVFNDQMSSDSCLTCPRNVRATINAALPMLENVQSQRTVNPQLVYDSPPRPSFQQSIGKREAPANYRANPFVGSEFVSHPHHHVYRSTRSPSMPIVMAANDINRATVESIMRAAEESDLFGGMDSAMKKVSGCDDATESKGQTEIPHQSYGMYYMRVQSYNSLDDHDQDNEIKKDSRQLNNNENINADLNNDAPQQGAQPVDVIEALQELAMGQVAMINHQEQNQQWNKHVHLQQATSLKEIQKQLDQLKKAILSGGKNQGITTSSTTSMPPVDPSTTMGTITPSSTERTA